MEQTVIIGAGLAGLSAAWGLKNGFRLLEKRDIAGGLVETVEERGFRFDRTGHLLHLRDRRIRRLVGNLLDQPPLAIQRESRIFSHHTYTHYPFQANTHGLPPKVVAECLNGFFDAQLKRASGKGRADDSFESFIYAHFGEGIARHFMVPYNARLWGVHPSEITAGWCQRFVPIPEVEEVVAGAVGVAQEQMGYNAHFVYPERGIGELSDAFARRVRTIEYKTAPTAIDSRRRRIRLNGQWVAYRALINTAPLDEICHLLVDAPKSIVAAASKLRCTRLRYLDVALNRKVGQPYHWIYVPEKRYPFYRVGCYSNFSKAMAPRNCSNLYVELVSRQPVRRARVLPRVVEGLIELGLIAKPADIEFVAVRHIPRAYVIYDHNYERVVPKLLNWLAARRIYCAGRYARWEYAAMEDAILQGLAAAKRVKELD